MRWLGVVSGPPLWPHCGERGDVGEEGIGGGRRELVERREKGMEEDDVSRKRERVMRRRVEVKG